VASISLCPDERLIVSGSSDSTVRVWEVATGQQVRVLEGHTNWVCSVAWSRDGQYIVSGSLDKTVRIWEADVQVCTHVGRVYDTLSLLKLFKCWFVANLGMSLTLILC